MSAREHMAARHASTCRRARGGRRSATPLPRNAARVTEFSRTSCLMLTALSPGSPTTPSSRHARAPRCNPTSVRRSDLNPIAVAHNGAGVARLAISDHDAMATLVLKHARKQRMRDLSPGVAGVHNPQPVPRLTHNCVVKPRLIDPGPGPLVAVIARGEDGKCRVQCGGDRVLRPLPSGELGIAAIRADRACRPPSIRRGQYRHPPQFGGSGGRAHLDPCFLPVRPDQNPYELLKRCAVRGGIDQLPHGGPRRRAGARCRRYRDGPQEQSRRPS